MKASKVITIYKEIESELNEIETLTKATNILTRDYSSHYKHAGSAKALGDLIAEKNQSISNLQAKIKD